MKQNIPVNLHSYCLYWHVLFPNHATSILLFIYYVVMNFDYIFLFSSSKKRENRNKELQNVESVSVKFSIVEKRHSHKKSYHI